MTHKGDTIHNVTMSYLLGSKDNKRLAKYSVYSQNTNMPRLNNKKIKVNPNGPHRDKKSNISPFASIKLSR